MTTRNNTVLRGDVVRRLAAAAAAGALLSGAILFAAPAGAELKDTDGDNIFDSTEINQFKTDPYNWDTDGDGLSDYDDGNTGGDPLKYDTDGDGLSDGLEVNTLKTDPRKANPPDKPAEPAPEAAGTGGDTDGDGLADRDELKFFTNLFLSDSDLDGVSDGDEVKNGSNPLNVFSN